MPKGRKPKEDIGDQYVEKINEKITSTVTKIKDLGEGKTSIFRINDINILLTNSKFVNHIMKNYSESLLELILNICEENKPYRLIVQTYPVFKKIHNPDINSEWIKKKRKGIILEKVLDIVHLDIIITNNFAIVIFEINGNSIKGIKVNNDNDPNPDNIFNLCLNLWKLFQLKKSLEFHESVKTIYKLFQEHRNLLIFQILLENDQEMSINNIMIECNKVLELKGDTAIRDEKTYRNDLGQLAKYNLVNEIKFFGNNAKTKSYRISEFGKLWIKSSRGVRVILNQKLRNFFIQHNTLELPNYLLTSIGNLIHSEIIDNNDNYTVIEEKIKSIMNNAQEKILTLNPIIPYYLSNYAVESLSNNKHLVYRQILPSKCIVSKRRIPLLTKKKPDDSLSWIYNINIRVFIRVVKELKFFMICNENEVLLIFLKKGEKCFSKNFTKALYANTSEFVSWCTELFFEYWNNSKMYDDNVDFDETLI